MKPKTRMDYVELYAKKLRNEPLLFEQQRMLIDSQIIASRELFRNMFGEGKDFEKKARSYLKARGII
ncbi:MAG TPA: hypothetical protein VI979_04320 [archaeon]|nr:hypothetical protein [archaeon]